MDVDRIIRMNWIKNVETRCYLGTCICYDVGINDSWS